ncbi:cytochrome c oxidase polypeptide vib [Penicillium atrosanguineum]|nr:cytochrome c oxidase polypeptide vib [Penicillium atrosanguineum]
MGAIPEHDPDEPVETKPFKFVTGYDARFPQQNQTKHCWQNYVDYYKCVEAKGDDFRPASSSTTLSAPSAPRPGPTAGTASARPATSLPTLTGK